MENEYIDLPSGNLPYATKREVKFMDLLNEYLAKYYAEHGNKNLYIELEGWSIFNVHEIVVISRRFGFIKWLVDNDKIDLGEYKDKSELYTLKVIYGTTYYIDLLTNKVNLDFLLMLLSIQDNPIEFLTNIIK